MYLQVAQKLIFYFSKKLSNKTEVVNENTESISRALCKL